MRYSALFGAGIQSPPHSSPPPPFDPIRENAKFQGYTALFGYVTKLASKQQHAGDGQGVGKVQRFRESAGNTKQIKVDMIESCVIQWQQIYSAAAAAVQ